MKEALDLAMKVQQNLLPRQPLKNEFLEIAGKSIYCEKTGGDYFDFFPLPGSNGNKIVVAVGDVVGHGIPAALLMTTVRALLRSRMSQPGNLARSIADVNRLLCMDTSISCDYMTLFVMVIDATKRELSWVRAGHEPAIIYDPATDAVAELYGSGMALGIDSDFIFEEYRRSNFTAGQVIAMGTDGIWETESPAGEKFGRDRFRQTISSHGKQASQEILQALMQQLATFRKAAPQHDDITLVVVKAKK
jgi:phosphoserine phosphatase RsbU/P